MIIVADTSPINYLVLIDEVDLLQKLFSHIVIPEGVLAELQHPKAPPAVQKWIATLPVWVEVKSVHIPNDPELARLGRGEQEAIALAEMLHADLLLIDEKKGFAEATKRSLRVAGTLFVLEEAAAQELIELPPVIDKLRQTSFRIAEIFLTQALQRDTLRKAIQEDT
jgi:predicted nucleic acid-binding protein